MRSKSEIIAALKNPGIIAVVRAEKQEQVLSLFEQAGQDLLGPLNATLGGAVPYRELHLLRLYRRCLLPQRMDA